MRILLDQIKDSSLTWGPEGMQVVRSIPVVDISVTPGVANADALWNAVNASGIPAPYSAHPTAGLAAKGLVVQGYDVGPTSPPAHDKAIVKVIYKGRYPMVTRLVSWECGLVQEITDLDKDGNPLVVRWFPLSSTSKAGDTIPNPIPVSPKSHAAGGQVQAMKPYKKLIVRQIIVASSLNGFDDAKYIDPFLGYLNAATYRSQAAKTWLCISASATTENGYTYTLTREVMWKPTTWKQNVAYILPDGRRPPNAFLDPTETVDPKDATTYAGKKTNGFFQAEIYGTADFSSADFVG